MNMTSEATHGELVSPKRQQDEQEKKTPLTLAEHRDMIDKLPFEDTIWYIKLDNDFAEMQSETCELWVNAGLHYSLAFSVAY